MSSPKKWLIESIRYAIAHGAPYYEEGEDAFQRALKESTPDHLPPKRPPPVHAVPWKHAAPYLRMKVPHG